MPATVDGNSASPQAARENLGGETLPGAGATPESDAQFDVRILRALRRIIRGVEIYSRQLLATSRITAPQLVCLLAVVESGPMTATAIGRDVQLSASTVVGILDRLEEKGLVVRTRADDDRRVVLVSATMQGILLAKQAPSPLQQTLATRLAALPPFEQATIALSIERIVSLMEKKPETRVTAKSVQRDGLPAP